MDERKTLFKSEEDIKILVECGRKLAKVKETLRPCLKEGVSAKKIDLFAESLIKKEGGFPSFKMVRGYKWSTCVNLNDGVVHGIPREDIVIREKDIVSVDLGMFYRGFHTDTAFSVGVKIDTELKTFLEVGEQALNLAISKSKVGARIYDISLAIENTLKKHNLSPIKALVGHGIGRNLHEEPPIPCFAEGNPKNSAIIKEGEALAIEVMYTFGSGEVKLDPDDWTIRTSDGKISAFFEETILVTQRGPLVLTKL